jgi:hypothetical protein
MTYTYIHIHLPAAYVHTLYDTPILFTHAGVSPNFYAYLEKKIEKKNINKNSNSGSNKDSNKNSKSSKNSFFSFWNARKKNSKGDENTEKAKLSAEEMAVYLNRYVTYTHTIRDTIILHIYTNNAYIFTYTIQ